MKPYNKKKILQKPIDHTYLYAMQGQCAFIILYVSHIYIYITQ